jgi:hypothetical protein
MKLHGCTHFLQDSAPCHASEQFKAFLAVQPFQVIDWPRSSPDLNLIANSWNFMKNLLEKKDMFSVSKLTTAIKMMWTIEISTDHLKKLVTAWQAPDGVAARWDMTVY